MKIHFSGSDDEFLNTNNFTIAEDKIIEENITTLRDLVRYIYKIKPRAHKSFFKLNGILQVELYA